MRSEMSSRSMMSRVVSWLGIRSSLSSFTVRSLSMNSFDDSC